MSTKNKIPQIPFGRTYDSSGHTLSHRYILDGEEGWVTYNYGDDSLTIRRSDGTFRTHHFTHSGEMTSVTDHNGTWVVVHDDPPVFAGCGGYKLLGADGQLRFQEDFPEHLDPAERNAWVSLNNGTTQRRYEEFVPPSSPLPAPCIPEVHTYDNLENIISWNVSGDWCFIEHDHNMEEISRQRKHETWVRIYRGTSREEDVHTNGVRYWTRRDSFSRAEIHVLLRHGSLSEEFLCEFRAWLDLSTQPAP